VQTPCDWRQDAGFGFTIIKSTKQLIDSMNLKADCVLPGYTSKPDIAFCAFHDLFYQFMELFYFAMISLDINDIALF